MARFFRIPTSLSGGNDNIPLMRRLLPIYRPMKIRTLLIGGWMMLSMSARADYGPLVQEMVQPLMEEKFVAACVVGVVDHDRREIYGYGVTRLGSDDKPDG